MQNRYRFPKGRLKIGQYKTIELAVDLKVTTTRFDKYSPEESSDGVQAEGELSFESYPVDNKHPVRLHTTGALTVLDGKESSKFNIILMEKTGERVIVPNHIKKYFWLFCVLGEPIYDQLNLYPEWSRKSMNKVFYCKDFRGIWPQGVSSIIVASHPEVAKNLLLDALKKSGIAADEQLTIEELDLKTPHALVLNNGSF